MDDDTFRKAKLPKLIEIEGYASIEELIGAAFSDAVVTAFTRIPSRAQIVRVTRGHCQTHDGSRIAALP
jgi:hypothetical protein